MEGEWNAAALLLEARIVGQSIEKQKRRQLLQGAHVEKRGEWDQGREKRPMNEKESRRSRRY